VQLVNSRPGRTAGAFRGKCGEFMARLCGGDLTLIPLIQQQNAALSDEARDVIMEGVAPPVNASAVSDSVLKRVREEHLLLDIEERRAKVQVLVQGASMKMIEVAVASQDAGMKMIKARMDMVEAVRPLDDRDRLYFKDMIMRAGRPGYDFGGSSIVAIAPGDSASVPVPVAEVAAPVAGREISIALVCAELGLHPGSRSSAIGKRMVQCWRKAHPGRQEPPKRDTLYQGRPYLENAYFQADYEMLADCCREVLNV
jgi:hypothetical protein